MQCPRCHSTHIWKAGFQKQYQRYQCKRCKRQFVFNLKKHRQHVLGVFPDRRGCGWGSISYFQGAWAYHDSGILNASPTSASAAVYQQLGKGLAHCVRKYKVRRIVYVWDGDKRRERNASCMEGVILGVAATLNVPCTQLMKHEMCIALTPFKEKRASFKRLIFACQARLDVTLARPAEVYAVSAAIAAITETVAQFPLDLKQRM